MPARQRLGAMIAMVGLILGSLPASHADTLLIEAVRQGAGVECPANGQSMGDVEARFGTPKSKEPATGHPPITRWVYGSFTVYFEGNRVLHSVVHRK